MDGTMIRRAESSQTDARAAVLDIAEQLGAGRHAGVVFFCSADYDLELLGRLLQEQFSGTLIGCTTAGEIGSAYTTGGIVAAAFSSQGFSIHPSFVPDVEQFDERDAMHLANDLRSRLNRTEDFSDSEMFGLLLIDGLTKKEESVAAAISNAMRGVPIIGGSAGDSMKFEATYVYWDGVFHQRAGIFTLVETNLDFEVFKLQHFEPSEIEMVVTESDPEQRIVYEIDGGIAGDEYAKGVGCTRDELSLEVFSRNPLMLKVGGEWFVRSIKEVNSDGSLTFFCAIETGLPLTVATGTGLLESLRQKVIEIQGHFSQIECTLGCDCALRKVDLIQGNLLGEVAAQLAKINFLGFSTFGEQFGALHINQTLTGVVLGKR